MGKGIGRTTHLFAGAPRTPAVPHFDTGWKLWQVRSGSLCETRTGGTARISEGAVPAFTCIDPRALSGCADGVHFVPTVAALLRWHERERGFAPDRPLAIGRILPLGAQKLALRPETYLTHGLVLDALYLPDTALTALGAQFTHRYQVPVLSQSRLFTQEGAS